MDEYERQANLEYDSGYDECSVEGEMGLCYPSSEESDEEYCYAQPPEKDKIKYVDEVFNEKTAAKDIIWRAGMVFADKKQFKCAVRASSMATGRPYQYLVDDKIRIQVACTTGCPFKMWVNYIKENSGWQIKTLNNDHNCIWDYKNKLVTVMFLVELYGDKIRKNPNCKLREMQEEFKRDLKVDVCEAKCCKVRKQALSELLIEDLELYDGAGKTLISDQQKGLDKAIRELLPEVEHRFCNRHLVSNLKKINKTNIVRNAFWDAATATHLQAFKKAMKNLERHSKPAATKMKELDPSWWSKAYFKTHSKTESTENNMSECFNSWIMRARYMPLIDMLTKIHDMLMTRLHEKRDTIQQIDCVVVPSIRRKLEEAVEESVGYKVLWDGRENYVVKGKGSSFSVNLQQKTCSCRVWDLTRIPCSHAMTAIQESRQNPLDFVHSRYTKETYMKTYSYMFEVIKREEFWKDEMGDQVLPQVIVKKLKEGRVGRLCVYW
ncbi:hypothetical protein POM88_035216 [Heracleum sosnowskyi]|uniref:SWIM-type domain-containing protein n=1 Tax=Heracleum sosnowskyi TaxID=360622 RepID=A0AAD8MDW5_9APIA|nr:hypothetical protein POM88_035216 [Heracleum sosnowskyi]